MTVDPAALPDSPVIWSVWRRPHATILIWCSLLGLAAAVISWWFITHLYHPEAHLLGIGIGLGIGGLIPLQVGRGSRCRIHADGQLVFGFSGPPNLVLPLSAITAVRPVRAGLLRGVGLCCDPRQITFLHRKGLSYPKLEQYRRGLGVDLVLEFLTEADARDITRVIAAETIAPDTAAPDQPGPLHDGDPCR